MKERDSNIELLRIISMLMITIHHVLINTRWGCIAERSDVIPGFEMPTLLNGLVYVGVNCFVLISGYYGIKFSWKKLFNYYLICAFYPFVISVIRYFGKGIPISWYSSLFCISNDQWFINCYFHLMLISPFLNYANKIMQKRMHALVVLLLTIASVYFGFWRGSFVFNTNGYTLGQLVYMYFIGGFVSKYIMDIKKHRVKLLVVYVISGLCWGILTVLKYKGFQMEHWRPITYNNPFTLIGSVAFFCFMLSFSFKNKVVNWAAKSTFAVFLFSKIWYASVYKIGVAVFGDSILGSMITAIIGAIAIMLISIGFDQFRIQMFRPIMFLWDKVDEKSQPLREKILCCIKL